MMPGLPWEQARVIGVDNDVISPFFHRRFRGDPARQADQEGFAQPERRHCEIQPAVGDRRTGMGRGGGRRESVLILVASGADSLARETKSN